VTGNHERGRCIIRKAGDADLPALVDLYRAFIEETVSTTPNVVINPRLNVGRAVLRLLRSKSSIMLSADAEGEVVGFAFVEFRPGTRSGGWLASAMRLLTGRDALTPVLHDPLAWLAHIYVAPDFRRRGVGTGLLHAAADWSRAQGARTLELNVLDANEPAAALYHRTGMTGLLRQFRLEL
jgi:GNAT superfamily N-acetyltransferase